MKVKDIMTTDIITVDKDEDLSHVLSLMKKHDITKIPVLEEKQLVGIITDSKIAHKLGSVRHREVSTARFHASSVTEKNVPVVSPLEEINNILRMVGKPGPTMLPVVDANKYLIGVLTKADFLHLVTSKKPVGEIMQKNLRIVAPGDRVIHARRIMVDDNVARIPVVEQGILVGIVSDFEIALAFASLKDSFSVPRQKHRLDEMLVKDVMKTSVIWTTKTVNVAEAAKIMLKYSVGALPIVEDDKLIGIVTRTDLLKTIVQ
ncbi:MAG: CBS domain-containing protein [Candidatus Thermoplasmatota archaeon]|nr:CBS domain-containing protein [Candidatus Thermoplasmatota archaeon]MBU1940176.1 CBS domain-containing protein [Candidatus Thermoplasmatota archaeon]